MIKKTTNISEIESWNRKSKKLKMNKLLSASTPAEQGARAPGQTLV